jgi:hypothetical protein
MSSHSKEDEGVHPAAVWARWPLLSDWPLYISAFPGIAALVMSSAANKTLNIFFIILLIYRYEFSRV